MSSARLPYIVAIAAIFGAAAFTRAALAQEISPRTLRADATVPTASTAAPALLVPTTHRTETGGTRFFFDLEWLFLKRYGGAPVVLAETRRVGFGVPPPTTLLSRFTMEEISFDLEPTARVTVGLRRGRWSFEVGAFRLFEDWRGSARYTPQNGSDIRHWVNGMTGVSGTGLIPTLNSLSVASRTSVYGVESSLRHRLSRSTSALVGWRYMRLEDELDLMAAGTNQGSSETDATTVRADNDLAGLQGGVDWVSGGALGIELSARAGALLNLSDQTTEETSTARPTGVNNPLIRVHGSETSLALLVGGTAAIRYRVVGRTALRAGIDFLSLGGVALAPEQLELLGDAVNHPAATVDLDVGIARSGTLRFLGVVLGMHIEL